MGPNRTWEFFFDSEIGYYKKLDDGETIPEGAIGCYIPTDRPNLAKRFEAIKDELKKHKEKTVKQIPVLTRLHLIKFKNQFSLFGKGFEAVLPDRINVFDV